MIPINILTSTAAHLPLPNIDTDQIIPKQFLKRIERTPTVTASSLQVKVLSSESSY